MKNKILILPVVTAALVAMSALAQTSGCGSGMSGMAGCSMMMGDDAKSGASSMTSSGATNQLPQSIKTLFDNYLRIQTALAKDSVEGVTQSAQAIATSIKGDELTTFSTNVVQQAEAVAKASDLAGVREAFKSLSQSLIDYVSKYPAIGSSYREVHCSMANASWLQTESVVNNPYLGSSMLHCGQFVSNPQSHSTHMH